VDAIRFLALVPVLQSIYILGADALTGADYQLARSVLHVFVAALNVCLNLWMIPRYSWQGAAFATLVSEAALAIAMWTAVIVINRRQGALLA
jgi:O-antigen/teichoic acid export membrane protein